MGKFRFRVLKTDGNARYSIMETKSGTVELPNFMPVCTTGTPRSLTTMDLHEMGVQIIVANTYHLHLRPGEDVVEKAGGLHRFINFRGSILTDSGGFQVFSLARLRKITEDGIEFRSHIDGSPVFLSPEKVVEIQSKLGSDIMMILDYPTRYPSTYEENLLSVKLTTRWAERSLEHYEKIKPEGVMFAIVQGGFYRDLREKSLRELVEMDFPGYAIGGLALGEPRHERDWVVEEFAPRLPWEKPRYVMGLGKPEEILHYVEQGVDLFDCVIATRNARRGAVFTRRGIMRIKNARFREDFSPIDPECDCRVCRNYSRAYIRHLFSVNETTAGILASYHSVYFFIKLMKDIREAIKGGYFREFKEEFLRKYSTEGTVS